MVSGCSSTPEQTLFNRIGGQAVVNKIANEFTRNIARDTRILPYFKGSSVSRFKSQFAVHLCSVTDGPCQYKGDTMQRVHDGMNITEGDFNHTVKLLWDALAASGLTVGQQNEVIARLAPMRKDIIYR
jgi:hemoglobin